MNGSERIAAAFEKTRSEGRAALMPYMLAGYPDRNSALEIANAYVDAGADLIELGVPFSDPLADGPVIHEAATKALLGGAGLEDALDVVRAVGDRVPVILMCYVNMVLARGIEAFATQIAEAGVCGLLMPDLPHRESPELEEAVSDRGVCPIHLVAPTTTRERTKSVCETADGFIYLVSSVGTTGVRGELSADLAELVDSVREDCLIPVAVGFGVGTPEQAATVGRLADGVIIGSKLVKLASEPAGPAGIQAFLGEVSAALNSGGG